MSDRNVVGPAITGRDGMGMRQPAVYVVSCTAIIGRSPQEVRTNATALSGMTGFCCIKHTVAAHGVVVVDLHIHLSIECNTRVQVPPSIPGAQLEFQKFD